jgi:aryl-alcohol dehydrogenase-like predicted oxidoreductase
MVQKIGVSIYDPADLDELMQAMEIDLVQAPYNVFDRRLFRSGWLDRLHRQGVEVHARSAFLQGLLLMRESELPSQFAPWRPLLSLWAQWRREQGLSAVRASLGFVLRTAGIDRVIVGVETAAQLQEIVDNAWALENDVPAGLACDDCDLIDPSLWKNA